MKATKEKLALTKQPDLTGRNNNSLLILFPRKLLQGYRRKTCVFPVRVWQKETAVRSPQLFLNNFALCHFEVTVYP